MRTCFAARKLLSIAAAVSSREDPMASRRSVRLGGRETNKRAEAKMNTGQSPLTAPQ